MKITVINEGINVPGYSVEFCPKRAVWLVKHSGVEVHSGDYSECEEYLTTAENAMRGIRCGA